MHEWSNAILHYSLLRSFIKGDPPHRDFPLHKGRGWLVVDGGESGYVTDQLVQKRGLQQIGLLRYDRFLGQHNFLETRKYPSVLTTAAQPLYCGHRWDPSNCP